MLLRHALRDLNGEKSRTLNGFQVERGEGNYVADDTHHFLSVARGTKYRLEVDRTKLCLFNTHT